MAGKVKTPRKRDLWLKHYLNESNPETFLKKSAAAKAAGYDAKSEACFVSIGCINFSLLSDKIQKWLDETGLSDNALKSKLVSLMEAKETKFFAHEGIVVDKHDVDAIETQRKTLDMALKVKGLYAPEKHEHTGKDGGPIEVVSPEIAELLARVKGD